jgi:DNA-directed RNA polymerase specialized sigma24 family protein
MVSIAVPVINSLPATGKCALRTDQLLEHAKKGEQQAFLTLFQIHSQRIYSNSLRLTGNVTAAEDLTRDIFVEAFKNLTTISNEESFATLLYCCTAKTILARRFKSEDSGNPPVEQACFAKVEVGFQELPQTGFNAQQAG